MTYDASKVTPRPWRIEHGQWADHSEDGGGGFTIYMGDAGPDKGTVQSAHIIPLWGNYWPEEEAYPEMHANARHIVHCVNTHEALVEALERAVSFLPVNEYVDDDGDVMVKHQIDEWAEIVEAAKEARAALARARGGQ